MKLYEALLQVGGSNGVLWSLERSREGDVVGLGATWRVQTSRTMSDHVLSIDIGDEVLKGKLVMSSVSGLLYLLWDPLS